MEDSPLSITANVAGILTLITAIAASLFVRFKVLQDGYDELKTTMDSVMANIAEINAIEKTVEEEDTRPAAVRMQKLFTELLGIEFSILAECNKAYYGPAPRQRDPEGRPGPKVSPRRISQSWTSKLREILALQIEIMDFDIYILSIIPALWATLRFLITVGNTPTLLRWYRVRDVVKDKVRKRDILRSQTLRQQIVLLYM